MNKDHNISSRRRHTANINSEDTVFSIIRKNVFTYFNLVFAIITVLLLIAKSYRSLTFLPIIIANMGIGIFQQLRSKKVLDKLNVLAQASYTVEREGKEMTVPMDELEIGDVIFLEGGQQIPADGTLCEGTLNVNEALLTGEEDEIEKIDGSTLMSGSFVVSGKGKAKLTAVGSDCYAAQLTTKAKEIKNKKSDMVKNIELVIEVAGIVIIPIAIALYVEAVTLNHKTVSEAIVSMVGAIIGLIPEGLYLLLTVALALGAMFLAQKMVLLHDMRSIETLARVDVLCVDKTGTITSNEMSVTEVFLPEGDDPSSEQALLTRYIQTVDDGNITMTAMKEFFGEGEAFQNADVIPFTSKLKYSQVETDGTMYRLGAPDILLSEDDMKTCGPMIEERAEQGLRVLVFVKVDEEQRNVPLLFVVLKNGIRKNAPETFTYFKRQGVRVKVISGDNPVTVSKIACSVGIPHADEYVDATTLATDEDIEEAVKKYTVFGRVKPEQKKSIVLALKKQKLKVAMTGDGVNDILAMKEADCSIAMGSGSDAARQAAQVVLLDSDFSRMKYIVSRGRQIINNITRSATLFLFKNIFSFLLAVFSILAVFNYPLVPSHLSIVTTFNIGIPAFLLSLETNIRKQKISFFKKTLLTAGPAALTAFVSIAILVVVGEANHLSNTSVGMISLYMLELAAVLILLHVARPFNLYRSIVVGIAIGGFVLCNLIPLTRNIYMISSLTKQEWIIFLSFALVEFLIIQFFTWLFDRVKDQVNEQIEKIERSLDDK
ncbi:MAG: HAD-IC family P-type ATPase [Clostridiales bacterium]|nr:HAD-IC family P-type ATPase [Clostridiales bacterium]